MTTDAALYAQLVATARAAGRPDVAGELLRRLATLPPAAPPADAERLHAAGVQHLHAGRFAEAEESLVKAIRARPEVPSWVDHLGVSYASRGRFPEAEVTFRLAADLDPVNPSPSRNLIQACFDQKKWPEALTAVETALRHDPASTDLKLHRAVALSELKRYAEAEDLLAALLAAGPESAALWNRLGVVRGLSGRPEEAVACFERQIALEPHVAGAHANLAAALGKATRWAEAVVAGRTAVELDPASAGGWANLGNAYRDLGRLDEAADALRKAIDLDPTAHESYGNFALTLAMNGRAAEALPWYDQAIRRQPEAAEVRFNRAIALLSLGDYERGWPEYEWRWRTEQMRGQTRQLPTPLWRGEPLHGKTLLVHTEQGSGDTIQFLKLAPRVVERGGTVAVVTTPALADLVRTCPGVTHVVLSGEPAPPHHAHCPLMSLPLLTQLRVETIPAAPAFVTAPPAEVAKWRDRVRDLPRPLVGIAWQGNPRHVGDRWRSVKLAQFAPLAARLADLGGTLVSLQKGPGVEQLADAPFPVLDLGGDLGDRFADAAGLLMNLDRVVTIDSALAHLSGALGKPVEILLPLNADWRWLHGRRDTPWYPTATLHRQARFGEWELAFASATASLS